MKVILEGQKKRGRQKETKKHRNRVKGTKIYGIVYIIYTQDYIEKDKARLSKKRENRIFGRENLLDLASLGVPVDRMHTWPKNRHNSSFP